MQHVRELLNASYLKYIPFSDESRFRLEEGRPMPHLGAFVHAEDTLPKLFLGIFERGCFKSIIGK